MGPVYTIFGTSSGEIEFFKINIGKKKLEHVNKNLNLKFAGSVLSMKRLKLKDAFVLIVGLSNGDISMLAITFDDRNELQVQILGTLQRAHDFGVNSLDALTIEKSA